MAGPVDPAEIVRNRKLGGGVDVGDAECRAGKPAVLVEKIFDILQMRLGGARGLAQAPAVRHLARHHPLQEAFAKKRRRDLRVEPLAEPGGQPPRLGALGGGCPDERRAGHRLVEIFKDGRGIGEHERAPLEGRRLAGRVERRKRIRPLPGPCLDELEDLALLCQRKAHRAREGAERELVQPPHPPGP